MDNIEVALDKIFTIVESISKSHGNINAFMKFTEEKMPEKRDVLEIKKSIGRSDESLVSLIHQLHSLKELIDPIHDTRIKVNEIQNICPKNCAELNQIHVLINALNDSVAVINRETDTGKEVYTEALTVLKNIHKWSMVRLPTIMGFVLLIFLGINYFFLFDKLSDWTTKYVTKQKFAIETNLEKIEEKEKKIEKFLGKLGTKLDIDFKAED